MGSSTTNFLYEGDSLIAEYDASNTFLRSYVYSNSIDEPISLYNGTNTYYYDHDSLGSTSELTDSSGAVVEKYAYDAFGRTIIKDPSDNVLTQSAYGNRFAFTGRELDTETGLYYYRARMYSPTLGRFLQTDPVGYLDSINLYEHCLNNPINYLDPWGLYSLDAFLQDAANFSAGFGDIASLGITNYIREKMHTNYAVKKCGGLYKIGEVAGSLALLTTGVAGSFNAGTRTVLYSGKGALAAARAGKGIGIMLEETLGGRILSSINKVIILPQKVWDFASGVFAANAKGEVQVFLRNAQATGVYNRIERPIIEFLKNASMVFK